MKTLKIQLQIQCHQKDYQKGKKLNPIGLQAISWLINLNLTCKTQNSIKVYTTLLVNCRTGVSHLPLVRTFMYIHIKFHENRKLFFCNSSGAWLVNFGKSYFLISLIARCMVKVSKTKGITFIQLKSPIWNDITLIRLVLAYSLLYVY